MPTLMSRAAVACSAAAIVRLAPAAWAHGKPAGDHPHPAKSGHAAAHAVSAQLARVGRLAAAAGTSRVLNDADRAGLTVALVADVAVILKRRCRCAGCGSPRRRATCRAA